MKQDEQGDGKHSPGPLSDHSDAKDATYQPISKEEHGSDDDTFIILIHKWSENASSRDLSPLLGV